MRVTISIFENRVSVYLPDGKVARFAVWDITDTDRKDCEQQFKTAFAICKNFDDIKKHMKINGYECELEEITED